MKLLFQLTVAVVLLAAVIDASPNSINFGGGHGGFGGGMGGGAHGTGHLGGGRGGPGFDLNEDSWKSSVGRPVANSFAEVEGRSAFATRRLLVAAQKPTAVKRVLQEDPEAEGLEWREDMAGIKKHVRREIAGTPLPDSRFNSALGV